MPECTTCGNHVTHEYVRVFGDNQDSIDSCRNCRSSTRGQTTDEEEADRTVYLEDVLENPDRDGDGQSDSDVTAGGRDDRAKPGAEADAADGEDESPGRFGMGRLRSLFDR